MIRLVLVVARRDEDKAIPRSVFQAFAKSGLINLMVLHVAKSSDLMYPMPCGLTPETCDAFHELIVTDEVLVAVPRNPWLGRPAAVVWGGRDRRLRGLTAACWFLSLSSAGVAAGARHGRCLPGWESVFRP